MNGKEKIIKIIIGFFKGKKHSILKNTIIKNGYLSFLLMESLNQDSVSREASIKALKRIFDYNSSLLPGGLTDEERKKALERLSTSYSGGLGHIFCLYDRGYALGEHLSGLLEFGGDKIYCFLLDSLARHIMDAYAELEQALFITETEGAEREFRNYIASISPQIRRM